ncbi:Endochitinase B1 [Lachnellula willkommii]|uniref:chitinase n=1 Tax=Lachnellula willkommii TaxID=215461 RepID=A0A559M8H5_9HELO|nr:Endochitinase B1 [Lachnellula willkommii]
MHCPTFLSVLILCGFALSNQTYPFPNRGNSWNSSTPSQPDDAVRNGKRAVGFFGDWNIYGRNFTVADIPVKQLTHVIYAFANINNVTGEVTLGDPWADVEKPFDGNDAQGNDTNLEGSIKQLYLLKQQNRHLKTLLSVGGWTYSPNISPILHNETCRATFASSAVKLMYNLGFDGLDYDYEYINSTEQAAQFVDLLAKTRTLLDAYRNVTSPFLLTFDAPAGPEHYELLDVKGMDQYLDFWTFMAFDYTGAFTTPPYAGHAQNLYGSNDTLATPFNTSSGIEYYIAQGATASKLHLGNPLYGHAFQNTHGPGTPFNGTGNGSFGDAGGNWDYDLLPLTRNASIHEDEELGLSWSYDGDTKTMVSYDTPKIARRKARYVMDKGLGGVSWWQISGDKKGAESLVGATVDCLGSWKIYPDSPYSIFKDRVPGKEY